MSVLPIWFVQKYNVFPTIIQNFFFKWKLFLLYESHHIEISLMESKTFTYNYPFGSLQNYESCTHTNNLKFLQKAYYYL